MQCRALQPQAEHHNYNTQEILPSSGMYGGMDLAGGIPAKLQWGGIISVCSLQVPPSVGGATHSHV